ncbi:hypothetical protein [Pseudanabaena yagii]|uniref:Uncharacterized protein n=1 Tax=Pseudanabaena yagii GIHE-NHR1 TaxID=2722753 RepID=A0ABX1LNW1_9CYAN|nr:hypothetical protein [Pseudanabaena yagii]NMF57817.1 hypothetical protein [Pseudanabaena yagii GIHE-NHR1]
MCLILAIGGKFNVVLESIEEPNPKLKQPKVIEQKGKAPAQYSDDDDY